MRFNDSEILISSHADQKKTLREIDKIAEIGKNHDFIKFSVLKNNLRNDLESIKAIFNSAFNLTTFQPDPTGHQYIRTVNRFLKDRRGNCVDYTVFISAFLRAIRVPHIIRMVSFDSEQPKSYQHIYPLTINGLPLDAVYGQDQDGNEFKKSKSERESFFSKEVPFIGKYDKIVKI